MGIKSMKDSDFHVSPESERTKTNIVLTTVENLVDWGRKNSVWPLTFATSCCGIEMMATGASRHDFARFGVEVYDDDVRSMIG